MTKNKFRIITGLVSLLGLFVILIGIDIYTKSFIVHPDAVMTIHNKTTDKNTQAYAIGKMQVYIDETYRSDMPVWMFYVKTQAENNTHKEFTALDGGNEKLSLLQENSNNNANPFIMKLKVKNISNTPIYLNSANFKIRDVKNNIYKPNAEWQKVLGQAGMFSGTKGQNEINPHEEKVLWLVYGTPSQDRKDASTYQEYVRINYDDDSDLLATKVEFPFNFTTNYPIGDYGDIVNTTNTQGITVILIWVGLCIAFYIKKKDSFDED